MTHEAAQAFIARIVDGITRRDVPGLLREYSPDCELESPSAGGTVTGTEAVAQVYEAFFIGFPDLKITSGRVMVDGQHVIHVSTLSGTDHGGFMGVPPTHKPFRIPLVSIYTIQDGSIIHEQRVTDFTGLLVQIGVLKARPA